MSQWQPIDTAPKDGTKILIYDGVWITVSRWLNDDWVVSWNNENLCQGGDFVLHWMPLPAPPQETE
jgi:hypothetical protein